MWRQGHFYCGGLTFNITADFLEITRRWGQFGAVFDNDAGTITTYTNGNKELPANIAVTSIAPKAVNEIYLGAHDQRRLTGSIANVEIYLMALTDAQVQAAYSERRNSHTCF